MSSKVARRNFSPGFSIASQRKLLMEIQNDFRFQLWEISFAAQGMFSPL